MAEIEEKKERKYTVQDIYDYYQDMYIDLRMAGYNSTWKQNLKAIFIILSVFVILILLSYYFFPKLF